MPLSVPWSASKNSLAFGTAALVLAVAKLSEMSLARGAATPVIAFAKPVGAEGESDVNERPPPSPSNALFSATDACCVSESCSLRLCPRRSGADALPRLGLLLPQDDFTELGGSGSRSLTGVVGSAGLRNSGLSTAHEAPLASSTAGLVLVLVVGASAAIAPAATTRLAAWCPHLAFATSRIKKARWAIVSRGKGCQPV